MPESVAGSTFAVLALAAALAVSVLLIRRWGVEIQQDPFARLIRTMALPLLASTGGDEGDRRRWFRRRDREAQPPEEGSEDQAAPADDDPSGGLAAAADTPPAAASVRERPKPGAPPDGAVDDAPRTAAPARRLKSRRPPLDHVPFQASDSETPEERQERMRDRFRRGMRKTRDYLNRDVREVFGPGPVPEAFDDLEDVLVRADLGVMTASALADELRERGRDLTSDTLPDALKESMRTFLQDFDRRLRVNTHGLSVWLVVGVNGTGKTTTIAKLARHAVDQGFTVCLAAADTFRAAAIDQLQTWGERVGVDVVRQHPGADPGAVVFDAMAHAKARGHDLLIVDTAGRLHTRTPLMEELRKVRRVIDREPDLLTECLLVLDATTGQNGVTQARAFRETVEVTGLVLAKLDGTAKGGITFAVERELGIPVKVVGLGEKAEDLAPFDPESFVESLFEDVHG
ncbi:MAG TPA: signal recognition particle-docking protein FtsY [Actinomycetota bacterium]|nr:signal recognition particle-docking protein FtsY [Actinomycetota bacterium]